jgi:hypothetical protein
VWPRYEPLPGVKGYAALTGLPTDDATAALPVVAVKIDNHPSARPQWGLDEADVIVEENVESLTRFIALFHSRQPSMVGPVRSVRTSDTPVLAALNRPVLGWSGGNAGVIAEVNAAADAGVIVDGGVYTEGSCYHRDGSRSAPHNLVFDPNCGREASPTAGAARPIFAFGEPATPRVDGRVIDVAMDGVRVAWEYDDACRCYLRSQNGRAHLASSGAQIAATNVVVMRVDYVPSLVDARSPEASTVGSGPASVFRGGVQFDGEWYRPDAFSPFAFRSGGVQITLAPGTTFIELARVDA